MIESPIVDKNGKRIKRKALTEEIARASLTGVRQAWPIDSVSSGLTPERLAAILQDANRGDHHAMLTLAEEMEEREPHYGSVLGTRKRAVSGLELSVESPTDDKADLDRTEAVRVLMRRPAVRNMLDDLLDGLGKGYSVVEMVWNTKNNPWEPEYIWRDPRFFKFHTEDANELRIVDESDMVNGLEMPPYRFVVHCPKLKSGIPVRSGLARLACVSYMCKSYTLADWMRFIELFGLPIRVGKYPNNTKKEDIATLRSAVASLGSDAAAVMPESMQVEFIDVGKSSSSSTDLFQNIAQWLDKQISKAVLGQTMTADDGSSQAQANVHNEVRLDILKSDVAQLGATLNESLVKPFIDLNFGPQEQYPQIQLIVPEPEDIASLTSALEKLVPLGLEVEQSVIRDKLGLPDPAKDAVLLKAPEQTAPALNHESHCPHCHNLALNRESVQLDNVDEQAKRLSQDTAPMVGNWLQTIQNLLNQADSLESFQDQLLTLYSDLSPDDLANVMQLAMTAAELSGMADIQDLAEGV